VQHNSCSSYDQILRVDSAWPVVATINRAKKYGRVQNPPISIPNQRRYGPELEGAAGPASAEAVIAVNRAISARSEGHLSVLAALGANCGVHLARGVVGESSASASASAAALSLGAARSSATWATSRLVCEASLLVITLVVSAKREIRVAFHAR